MRKELYNMFRWSLSKAMENHPQDLICRDECNAIITQVWDDMVKDGDIFIIGHEE